MRLEERILEELTLEEIIKLLNNSAENGCEQCEVTEVKNTIERKDEADIITAMIEMPKSEFVIHKFIIDQQIYGKLKELIYESNLPMNLVYSLAIYEFIQKYEPTIKKMKSVFNE